MGFTAHADFLNLSNILPLTTLMSIISFCQGYRHSNFRFILLRRVNWSGIIGVLHPYQDSLLISKWSVYGYRENQSAQRNHCPSVGNGKLSHTSGIQIQCFLYGNTKIEIYIHCHPNKQPWYTLENFHGVKW